MLEKTWSSKNVREVNLRGKKLMNRKMKSITKEDIMLIEKAQALVDEKNIKGGITKEVGCTLITENGKIFVGVSLNLACGIGFCAEHTAISQMITKTDETHIKTIVAAHIGGVLLPCGRCRELINLLDEKNKDTEVILSNNKKIKLRELLPYDGELNDLIK